MQPHLHPAASSVTAKALGIYLKGFGFHTFRRQNVSWRQEAGATPFEAMKAVGHAKPTTAWDYTIPDAQREREHVKREDILAAIEYATGEAKGQIP